MDRDQPSCRHASSPGSSPTAAVRLAMWRQFLPSVGRRGTVPWSGDRPIVSGRARASRRRPSSVRTAAVLVLALTLALTGCALSPVGPSSPAGGPTSSPTPTGPVPDAIRQLDAATLDWKWLVLETVMSELGTRQPQHHDRDREHPPVRMHRMGLVSPYLGWVHGWGASAGCEPLPLRRP